MPGYSDRRLKLDKLLTFPPEPTYQGLLISGTRGRNPPPFPPPPHSVCPREATTATGVTLPSPRGGEWALRAHNLALSPRGLPKGCRPPPPLPGHGTGPAQLFHPPRGQSRSIRAGGRSSHLSPGSVPISSCSAFPGSKLTPGTLAEACA